jgi:hypothetical protein
VRWALTLLAACFSVNWRLLLISQYLDLNIKKTNGEPGVLSLRDECREPLVITKFKLNTFAHRD